MGWQQRVEAHWQQPRMGWRLLLWPWSRLFQLLAAGRRLAYRRGWLRQHRLPCPVVVVGNIHAGGVGKTPLTAALVQALQQRGWSVGLISRGYGRQHHGVMLLEPDSQAAEVGDEPLMLYRQTGVPMAVGSQRVQAAEVLLAAVPGLDVVLSDDGMQHYALARDVEIAVFPVADVGRPLDLLPNGGLREPVARLRQVDALVVAGGDEDAAGRLRRQLDLPADVWLGCSRLACGEFYRLGVPQQTAKAADFAGRQLVALAAIARPQRFFDTLRGLGLELAACHSLPDHAPIGVADIPAAEVVLITEKDAVKWPAAATEAEVWVLPVRADTDPDLAAWLEQRLQSLGQNKRQA